MGIYGCLRMTAHTSNKPRRIRGKGMKEVWGANKAASERATEVFQIRDLTHGDREC